MPPITYDESGVPYDSAAYQYDGADAPRTRTTQVHAEVIRYDAASSTRVSQVHTEVIRFGATSDVRVSQVHVEVIRLIWNRFTWGWGINGPSWQVV